MSANIKIEAIESYKLRNLRIPSLGIDVDNRSFSLVEVQNLKRELMNIVSSLDLLMGANTPELPAGRVKASGNKQALINFISTVPEFTVNSVVDALKRNSQTMSIIISDMYRRKEGVEFVRMDGLKKVYTYKPPVKPTS